MRNQVAVAVKLSKRSYSEGKWGSRTKRLELTFPYCISLTFLFPLMAIIWMLKEKKTVVDRINTYLTTKHHLRMVLQVKKHNSPGKMSFCSSFLFFLSSLVNIQRSESTKAIKAHTTSHYYHPCANDYQYKEAHGTGGIIKLEKKCIIVLWTYTARIKMNNHVFLTLHVT